MSPHSGVRKSAGQVKMQLILESRCNVVKRSVLEERQRNWAKNLPRQDGEPSMEMEMAARTPASGTLGQRFSFALALMLRAANPVSSAKLNTKERRSGGNPGTALKINLYSSTTITFYTNWSTEDPNFTPPWKAATC